MSRHMLTAQSVGRSQLPTHLPMRVTKLAAAKPNLNLLSTSDFIGQTIERDRTVHLITKKDRDEWILLAGYIVVCRNVQTNLIRQIAGYRDA